MTTTTTLDERDQAILAERVAEIDRREGPRVGDFVRYADGVEHRVSHVWGDEADDTIQTSYGGSFYLGHGYVSFSGGLEPGVKRETLTLTGERKDGRVWFFHHDYATAHNGVDARMAFRVYETSEATR